LSTSPQPVVETWRITELFPIAGLSQAFATPFRSLVSCCLAFVVMRMLLGVFYALAGVDVQTETAITGLFLLPSEFGANVSLEAMGMLVLALCCAMFIGLEFRRGSKA